MQKIFFSVISSPLDQFEILNLLSLDAPILASLHISITNIGLYLTMGFFIVLTLNLLAINYNKVVSNNWSLNIESVYDTLHSIVINQIEWILNSPSKPHAFVSLPLQSGFSFYSRLDIKRVCTVFKAALNKTCTRKSVFGMVIAFIISLGIRIYFKTHFDIDLYINNDVIFGISSALSILSVTYIKSIINCLNIPFLDLSFLDDIKLFWDIMSNISSHFRKIDKKLISYIKVFREAYNRLRDSNKITINGSSSITQLDSKKNSNVLFSSRGDTDNPTHPANVGNTGENPKDFYPAYDRNTGENLLDFYPAYDRTYAGDYSNNPTHPANVGNIAGNSSNPTHPANVGNISGNTWGDTNQGRVGLRTGPIQVNDPLNQAQTGYNPNGTNQPLAGNIASALEHQYHQGNRRMGRFIFSPNHAQFVLDHLSYREPDLYRLITNPTGPCPSGDPIWYKLPNNFALRDSLRNAP